MQMEFPLAPEPAAANAKNAKNKKWETTSTRVFGFGVDAYAPSATCRIFEQE